MFQSTTKPQAVIPGPSLCGQVTARVGLSVMAIGGITAATAPAVAGGGGPVAGGFRRRLRGRRSGG